MTTVVGVDERAARIVDVDEHVTTEQPGVPAAPGEGRRMLDLLGWAGRTDVQRVDHYTRGSLYVIYWFLLLTSVPGTYAEAGEPWQGLVNLGLVVLTGVAGHRALGPVVEAFPTRAVPRGSRVLWFGAAVLAVLGWCFVVAEEGPWASAYLVVMATCWVLGGVRGRLLPWVLAGVSALLLGVATESVWGAAVGAAIALFFVFTVQSTLWLLGVVHELDRARRTEASLAVAEERLRFSRDVHDVMGRHLSVIAVQAELAATMVERGDDRAADRIRQVRATAHDALREARELARGYRELDLAQETEGAVALLTSAGALAEADLDALPEQWHEPVARLVREAVTNVLRHSAATRVRISYAEVGGGGLVEVRNDRPHAAGSDDGSGLATLARELAPLGARLTHGTEQTADGDDFVLQLRWDTPAHAAPGGER